MLFVNDDGECKIYNCTQSKKIHNCSECDNLHPLADKANIVPQNLKVFNLSLIKKLGLEKWAKDSWIEYLTKEFGS